MWFAFGLAHGWLIFVGVFLIPKRAFFDLVLYRTWMWQAVQGGFWPVLDGPWVYPAGALVPMVIPAVVSTTSTLAYSLGWCALVTALDAVAVRELARRGGARGAWWWLTFLVLLGPVAMGRLDAIVAPIVLVALLVAAQRPRIAAAILTAAAWIKVAPGALLIPLVMIARRPVRDVVVPAVGVCAGLVGIVAAGGGLRYLASFLTTQGVRGLQIESVAASPWVLVGLVRHDVRVVLNEKLSTWEIVGPGTASAARALDVVLPVAVAGLAWLIWRARSRPADTLIWGSLALLTLLIVANKVGSPQYIGWLAPPVAVALAWEGTGRAGAPRGGAGLAPGRIAFAVLGIAALTQLVFPLAYGHLLAGGVLISLVLVARNVALVWLLVSLCRLLARPTKVDPDDPDGPAPLVRVQEPVLAPTPQIVLDRLPR